MNCATVASTGSPLEALVRLGVACLLAGLILVVAARTGRGRGAATLVLLLLVAGPLVLAVTGSSTARAATPSCAPATRPSLTITQTSTNSGLAPGVAPTPISGVITNHGSHAIYVTAVRVRIAAVTKAPAAAGGPCDASDYVLTGVTMPVAATLAPGDSASFAGASIGFRNKRVNQDACKSATITLRYVSR